MFGWPQADKRYCTFAELQPHLAKIEEEGKLAADTEAAKRTPFQTAIYNLRNALVLYQRLKSGVQPGGHHRFRRGNQYLRRSRRRGRRRPQTRRDRPSTKEQLDLAQNLGRPLRIPVPGRLHARRGAARGRPGRRLADHRSRLDAGRFAASPFPHRSPPSPTWATRSARAITPPSRGWPTNTPAG